MTEKTKKDKNILKRFIKTSLIILITIVVILALIVGFVNIPFNRVSGIESPVSFYEDEKVLVLVPHQDDEIYGVASTILNYLRGGSEVVVAYSTNGDYYRPEDGPIRIAETEKVLTDMGVDENNIYFLGYGNNYKSKEKAIYMAADDQVVVSHSNYDKTYGTEKYPDFHSIMYGEPALYTKENLKADIKDLVLHVNPTVIYCVDFDVHVDHRTLSLMFDCAMGEILREKEEYEPRVFKVPVYLKKGTIDFFDGLNQNSITKPAIKNIYQDSNYDTDIPGYVWEDRLRLPSADGIWGWTRETSYLNDLFLMYKSQNDKSFVYNANSDDIAWERRTDSITYNAEVTVSSGENKERITDFMWTDTDDVVTPQTTYNDFLWQPSLSDNDKTIAFKFDGEKEVSSVVILEDPDKENNILNLSVYDGLGKKLADGVPDKYGKRTELVFEPSKANEIIIEIDSYEGNPGIAEIEIFEQPRNETEIIKLYLDNENETFVYEALINKNEEETALKLYSYPKENINWNDYNIQVSENASFRTEDDVLYISCDDKASITVTDKDNKNIKDTINIKKISKTQKAFYEFVQGVDETIYDIEMWYESTIKRTIKAYYGAGKEKIKNLLS